MIRHAMQQNKQIMKQIMSTHFTHTLISEEKHIYNLSCHLVEG